MEILQKKNIWSRILVGHPVELSPLAKETKKIQKKLRDFKL
jgi:lysyl-tRNA synthetase class II